MPWLSRSLHYVLLVVILCGGTWIRSRHLDAPFGGGFRGVNGAQYYGQFEKHYLELGLAGCRFGLILQSWPGTDEAIRDLNHPTLPSYLFHGAVLLVGKDRIELGLRLLPFIAASMGLLLLYGVGRSFLKPDAALIAMALGAVNPMAAYYGVMVVAEAFLLPMGCLVLWTTLRYIEGRGRLRTVVIVFFFGCLLDWGFYLFAPAAWMLALARGNRKAWRLLWLFPVGCLAFGTFVGISAYAAGGANVLFEELARTGRSMAHTSISPAQWVETQLGYLVQWYGWPLIALVASWVLATLFRWPQSVAHRDGALGFFLLAGALWTGIFFRHAHDHEFWNMGFAGGFFLAGGAAAQRAVASRKKPMIASALALVAASLVLGTLSTLDAQAKSLTTTFRDHAETINRVTDPGDIVVVPEVRYVEGFYVRARLFHNIKTIEFLERLILDPYQRLYPDLTQRPRLVALFDAARLAQAEREGAAAPAAVQATLAMRNWIRARGLEATTVGGFEKYITPK